MATFSKLKGCLYKDCPLCGVSTDIDSIMAVEKDRGDGLLKTLMERNEMVDERNKTITTLRSTLTEVLKELEYAAEKFKMPVLKLIEEFDKDEIILSSQLPMHLVARAMYHCGYILGFAVGREQSVEELFAELGLP